MKTLRSWHTVIRRSEWGWRWFLLDGDVCVMSGLRRFHMEARRSAKQAQDQYAAMVRRSENRMRAMFPRTKSSCRSQPSVVAYARNQ